jgi:hypothetical protein
MVSNNLRIRDPFPACGAEEMLGFDARVAEEVVRGYHGHEVGARHGGPVTFADLRVVDEEGWGEDAVEARPVLMGVFVSRVSRGERVRKVGTFAS